MAERKGIAVAGTVLLDKLYGISAYPEAGELTHIKKIDFAAGGLVPNNGIDLKKLAPKKKVVVNTHDFITDVRIGDALRSYSNAVRRYKKRSHYQRLHKYVYGDTYNRVFILFGLRRTGKTTLIRQILAEMTDADLEKTAFIQITAKNTLADVNKDLKYLQSEGYKYIFIDEVTLMPDFIEGAALLSDIYAAMGMKIVLSGTDSLGFLFSEDDQLYDRYYQVHTTHIPYREFEEILGIKGIDEYIRYGGTMSLSGVHYNEDSPFASKKNADEYVDSAIARNIQHSLKCYQYENHFRNLHTNIRLQNGYPRLKKKS